MPRIFVSYRREDSAGFAGRLADALEARFGVDNVFRDVDDIRPGEDFVRSLESALRACDALIPVIGRQWLSATDAEGRRRLDDPQDYVRLEISTALQHDLEVIPVLVGGAAMPGAADLPEPLSALARRQALALGDSTWSADLERLYRTLEPGTKTEWAQDRAGRGAARGRMRRFALVAGASVVLGALAAGGWLLRQRPPDLSGRWDLADGSFWMVQQSRRELQIEEVHYDSRQVWRAGQGHLSGDVLDVDLHYVFQPAVKLRGQLRLAPDARSISGTLVETPGEHRRGITLRR